MLSTHHAKWLKYRRLMKKAIIFDLDGTLWDSSQEVVDSWNVILSAYKDGRYVISLEMMQSAMGLTMLDIGRKLWPTLNEKEMSDLLSRCMEYENEYLVEHPGKLYPYVQETLEELKKDYILLIVSNAQKGYIEAFLKGTKTHKYFAGHLCWGDTKTSKDLTILKIIKDFNIDKAVYVGDTHMDEISTKKAGLPFIHAKYGFGVASNPDGVAEDFSSLPSIVKCILP